MWSPDRRGVRAASMRRMSEPVARLEAEAREALTTLWRARGLSPSSLEERSDGTLMASDRELSVDSETLARDADGDGRLDALVNEPLDLKGELGRGGMGVVVLAEQLAVRREVAVKRVSEGAFGGGLRSLLKEAWVGGYLEHPNVVPVHTLASVDGAPAVVMKRVEGSPWRELVRDPSKIPAGERDDPLGWHLRILLSVCDALELAHSRGVLHLDLKPDNVMIGAFGEVYVLDWGLAAGHGENAPAWLPPAHEIRSVAGTPDYMAPELAMGAGEAIGPATDVYLLGAILHEIVTTKPPHLGATSFQKLYRAYLSEPATYGDDVPDELAALLARALHKDPGARFPSVEALRAAVEAFLAHREADALAREARERLDALGALLADAAREELAVWHLYGACRFALGEASVVWAEHPGLAELESRLAEHMAGWAMDVGRLELAESYLDELEAKLALEKPDLRAELEAHRESARAKVARVEALEHLAADHDLEAGARFRRVVAVSLGVIFVVVNFTMGALERAGTAELGYRDMLFTGVCTGAVLAPYTIWKRGSVFLNRANSTLWVVCLATFFLVQGLWLGGMTLDIPFRSALALTPIFYLLAFAAVAVFVSARFVWSPILQVPTVILAALWPSHVFEIIGVGGGLSAALIGLAWRPRTRGAR